MCNKPTLSWDLLLRKIRWTRKCVSLATQSGNAHVCFVYMQHVLLYAGAQKNVGCAGVTIIIGTCTCIHFVCRVATVCMYM